MSSVALRFALRMLKRDWRAGELRVLIAALVLAAASVGTVGFFADRVKGALTGQANTLLGADLMLSGDRPLPDQFEREALARKLAVTPVLKFNSMVQRSSGDSGAAPNPGANAGATPNADTSTNGESAPALLADVKAVASGYPLRGTLLLVDAAEPDGRPAQGIPSPGETWPDTRLAARLDLRVGDTLAVGEKTLRVTAIVQQDPEVAGGFMALAPRLLMNLADVPATNLMQPGNRATHRLLVAGSDTDAYRTWVQAHLERGQRLESVRDLRPEIRQTLDRAEQFLSLSALVAVMLAAVAVALGASRYLRRHLDAAAMMRCLGAPQRQTLAVFTTQFLVVGLGASLVGTLLALAAQAVLVWLLGGLMSGSLPPPGVVPALMAVGSSMLLLFGFALPPLIALSRVPPLRVLRRDIGMPRRGGILAYALGGATIALLIALQARDLNIAGIMIGGIAGVLVLATLLAALLVTVLRVLPQRGYSWRYGLANLRRRRLGSSLQIAALGLGLMSLLLLTLVRGDLMRNWRASLPPDAPNAFLVNVLPEQAEGVHALLKRDAHVDAALMPMVRGRLVAINDKRLELDKLETEKARRLADREFNLSWSADLPYGNRIMHGRWWSPGESNGFSLEQGIADTLGIKVGDTVTYDIVGNPVKATVTSLRKVDWDSFRVNFFALFPPGVIDAMPRSYIAAIRADSTNNPWLAPLVRDYPNVLVIDVGELIRQVSGIMEKVARAVEFVFLFTLLGGVLVLEAAIASTQDERRYDAAILRTLGASQRQLNAAQVTEFLTLGSLAGLLAAAGATAVGYVLADRVFNIPFAFNPWLWLIGLVGGGVGVAVAGWLGTRSTLRQPPLAVLRQLA